MKKSYLFIILGILFMLPFISSFGTLIPLDNRTNLSYVPYTGAVSNVDLGTNNFTVDGATFFINSNLNRVGIGTSSPDFPLEVESSAGAIMGITPTGEAVGSDAYIRFNLGRASIGYLANLGLILQGGSDKDIVFHSSGTFAGNELIRIKSDGKVGIGTDSPDALLEIEKNAIATGLKLTRFSTNYVSYSIPSGSPARMEVSASGTASYRIYTASGGRFSLGDVSFMQDVYTNELYMNSKVLRESIIWQSLYDSSSMYNTVIPAFGDTLFYGNYRDITITSNRAPSSGSLNNLFDLNNAPGTRWTNVNPVNPVIINITYGPSWAGGKGPFLNNLEMIFSWRNANAINYTVDSYNDANDDDVYITERHCTVTNNYDYIEMCNINRWRTLSIIINITAAGDNDLAENLWIGTIQAKSSNYGSGTGHLAELGANTFYGAQTIKGNLIAQSSGLSVKFMDTGNYRNITISPGAAFIDIEGGQLHLNRYSTEDVVLVRGGGNVGINTTAPQNTLNVIGDGNFTGNMTFGQKITFAFGEIIDNIIDGWVRITGNLNVTGNVTAENVFLPSFLFAHTNDTIPVASAGVWYNVTFGEEESSPKFRITHTYNDNTNDTFTIVDDGWYNLHYAMSFSSDNPTPTSDIAMRVIKNGVEIGGSLLEEDATKQYSDFTISNGPIAYLVTGDEIKFQFTSDDTDVSLTSHRTYGDHHDTAVIKIIRIA